MSASGCGCGGGCRGEGAGAGPVPTSLGVGRREFVRTAALAGVGLAWTEAGAPFVAGPFFPQDRPDHFVPADKKLSADWVRALFARGEPEWFEGEALRTIGMPVGGVAAGQLYLTGDGRLVSWEIFNRNRNTGYGLANYAVGRAPDRTVENGELATADAVEQGFALRVEAGGRSWDRTLDQQGFPGVRFRGEYPVGRVRYADAELPVQVELEAFSPFVPLDVEASSLPVTVLRYTVANRGEDPAQVTLAGWLENALCLHSGRAFGDRVERRSEVVHPPGLTAVRMSVHPRALPPAPRERPPVVFADFEGSDYGTWTQEGAGFGSGPARGTLAGQNPVSGYEGTGLVNTYLGGDGPQGTLTSPPFTVSRPWISFLVGGGRFPGVTSVDLLVDGEVVRSATGKNRELLEPHNWDVSGLQGRTARIRIVDAASGGWGHVNVDQIEFRDAPRRTDPGDPTLWPDFGTLCLALAGEGWARASVEGVGSQILRGDADRRTAAGAERFDSPIGERLVGAVGTRFDLAPGESRTCAFLVSWHLPNLYREQRWVGNQYATRFGDAVAVADHVAQGLDALAGDTSAWLHTWYDSTLPWWLLDRIHSTVANLASTTCQWWANGRFWAWEGGGCCHGNCGHVWNYEHAMARLFPALERSVREMQDFAPGVGFHPESGAIGFRGEGWTLWAGDSQGGYVLKALREHQVSADDAFLRRTWPAARKATEFLIAQDADADGLIEGQQHQTYDQNYYGPNTMVGSLYLGALRAAGEMAREMGDEDFAATCRRIFERGRDRSMELLFDGEYFVQRVDLEEHPDWQYGGGCLADQLLGQGWAHQVGLGYLYPPDAVKAALSSVWKYCWAPDVGPQNEAHAPERWFAYPGEAGLFTCTWPKGPHMGPRSTRYRDEIWTGIEYQVAGNMAWEGMLTEALAICRGIHERYHPSKHNPWNEIECGDHYARALASWSVLLGLSGFEYHGPRAHVGFAPRITPEAFRCAFTAAEGWGSLDQRRAGREQRARLDVRWGVVRVRTLALAVPDGVSVLRARVAAGGSDVQVSVAQEGARVVLTLSPPATIRAGEALDAVLAW